MIISSNLSAIPFVSNTDTVRLQMAAKQIAQSMTHINCERPYVIGKNYKYIRLNQGDALYDGSVVYKDDTIMVVHYYGDSEELKTYDVVKYKHTKDGAASSLRYVRELGKFKKGDILFEYDGFLNGIPSFGYNLNVAFFPFFSYTCEDAIVISETAAKKCRQQKIETVLIPVYSYSSFKNIYPLSDYGFIPNIGQTIDGKVVFSQMFEKTIRPEQASKAMSFFRHNEMESSDMLFSSYNILTKYEDAEVSDIRVHPFRKTENFRISDNGVKDTIVKMTYDHSVKMSPVYRELTQTFGKDYATELIKKHYFWHDLSLLRDSVDFANLQCIIEVKLVCEHHAELGDKFANRYANKGVISLILPDELRPYSSKTGTPVDYICNPLSVFNRMNFGQIIEGSVAKAVAKVESDCKDDISKAPDYIRKFAKLSILFGDGEYSDELLDLANNLDSDSALLEEFRIDLENGLYIEAPSFVAIDAVELSTMIEEEFGTNVAEDIIIPVETFKYMRHKLGPDVIIPDNDVVMKDIFMSPMYILKLKHLASDKMTARDFGKYTKGSKLPSKVSGFDRASKLGSMEMDAFIAHNTLRAMKEFRTVKSDVPSMKQDLVEQILNTGIYNMPDESADEGVKTIINNLIKMVNN